MLQCSCNPLLNFSYPQDIAQSLIRTRRDANRADASGPPRPASEILSLNIPIDPRARQVDWASKVGGAHTSLLCTAHVFTSSPFPTLSLLARSVGCHTTCSAVQWRRGVQDILHGIHSLYCASYACEAQRKVVILECHQLSFT